MAMATATDTVMVTGTGTGTDMITDNTTRLEGLTNWIRINEKVKTTPGQG